MQHRSLILATILLLLTFVVVPTFGHHSASNFDMKTDTTLTGVVSHVEWTNPHAYVYMNVTDSSGASKEWAIEFAAVGHLVRMGLSPNSFKPGDRITVVGHVARNMPNLISYERGGTITTADGKVIKSGYPPPAQQGQP